MKRKHAVLLALILVIAAVAVFLLVPGPAPTRQKIRLPDGNIVTLGKVSFSQDSQHEFSFDDSASARFRRKLPKFLRRYFPRPGSMSSYGTSSNSLVLWFTLADGQTGAPLDFNDKLAVEVVDEHGCAAITQGYASLKAGNDPSIYPVTFTQFPRRQKTFRVRLRARNSSDRETNKPLAEFEIPNPVRGSFPVWTPEPLPASRTNGDLVFVLKDTANAPQDWIWRAPQFDILRGGSPALDWELAALTVAEATGNWGSPSPFCSHEPAWKLETEFLRNAKATFLPSEMFTIRNLRVPATGVAVQLTNTFSLQGKKFALCAIAGPGHFVYSNTVVTVAEPPLNLNEEKSHSSTTYQGPTPIYTVDVRRSAPHLAFVGPPLVGEERLLLRVRGPSGVARKLVPSHSYDHLWTFTLAGAEKPGPFDLDVILHRPWRAEFLVKPAGK